jgi:hypothetical protein
VRGVVAFISTLKSGFETITESANMPGEEEEEPSASISGWPTSWAKRLTT